MLRQSFSVLGLSNKTSRSWSHQGGTRPSHNRSTLLVVLTITHKLAPGRCQSLHAEAGGADLGGPGGGPATRRSGLLGRPPPPPPPRTENWRLLSSRVDARRIAEWYPTTYTGTKHRRLKTVIRRNVQSSART